MFKLSGSIPKPLCQQQVRNASSMGRKKKRITSYRTELRDFLGPKNFKGLYTKNPFFWAATGNSPKYMGAYDLRGATTYGKPVDWKRVWKNKTRTPLQPFRENEFCKSNVLVSGDVKQQILRDFYRNKTPVQKIGFTYGISIPRIEALIQLDKIEKQTEMPSAVGKMARRMEQMFPIMQQNRSRDDLTEIPIPKETRHQRFMSVAESEPFGPIDAANLLNIEPASETLEKLNNHDVADSKAGAKQMQFTAPQLEGEKAVFRFTNTSVGKVGFRYGASRDDRKHARKVKFTSTGQKVWA